MTIDMYSVTLYPTSQKSNLTSTNADSIIVATLTKHVPYVE